MLPRRHSVLAVLFCAIFLIAPFGFSQCIGDDGTSIPGTCCLPANPNLPAFPGFALPAEGACFLDCSLEASWTGTMFIGTPIPFFCDLYISQFTFASGATPISTSLLVMKYARTWFEPNATGTVGRQVWRFLVNTDVNYVALSSTILPCPVPPCTGIGVSLNLPVQFSGHIDFAYDCATNTWSEAVSLTHFCGTFMHSSGSTRPLPSPFDHPERSYCFVAPAPFVFAPNPPLGGPIVADQQRSTVMDLNASPILWVCMAETPILGGNLNPAFQSCPCATGPSIPSWTNYQMQFGYGCNTAAIANNFQPIPIGPALPTGMAAMSIGRYAGAPGTFPGQRAVDVWLGVVAAPDPCPITGIVLPFHIVTGVSTAFGDMGFTFPNPFGLNAFTDKFIDLENVLIPNGGVPTGAFMGIGSLFVSTQTWSFNVP